MQKERILWHERQDFSPVWREVLFFYLEQKGSFANGLVIAPELTARQEPIFRRELELCGFFFRCLEKQESFSSDFLSWLWDEVSTTGGRAHELSRVALLVPISTSCSWRDLELLRSQWSKQIPCPILFQMSPQTEWLWWFSEHQALFGSSPWLFQDEVAP